MDNYDVIIDISVKMHLTMIDGKAANAICDITSSQTCNLCGATPSIMNTLSKIYDREIDEFATQLGISPLHA